MKISSTGYFVLSITWIIVSLLWFLWIKSTLVGAIWLCIGIIALVVAFISRQNERK